MPGPDTGHNTLLIGQIIFYVENGPSGERKNWNDITIENITTKKIYTLTTDSDGTFFSIDLPSGNYLIKKLQARIGDSTALMTYTARLKTACDFTTVDGKVNNFGLIRWGGAYSSNKEGCSMNRGYDQVFNFFKENFPDSPWLKREWVSLRVPKSANKDI